MFSATVSLYSRSAIQRPVGRSHAVEVKTFDANCLCSESFGAMGISPLERMSLKRFPFERIPVKRAVKTEATDVVVVVTGGGGER